MKKLFTLFLMLMLFGIGSSNAQTFELVTNVNDLKVDDQILFVAYGSGTVSKVSYQTITTMGEQKATYRESIEISRQDGSSPAMEIPTTIVKSETDSYAVFELGGEKDAWTFYDGTGYLQNAATSEKKIITDNFVEGCAEATITIDNEVATIVYNAGGMKNESSTNPTRYLDYNFSSPRFTCYAANSNGTGSTQTNTKMYIYRYHPTTSIPVTITSAGYATLCYADKNLVVPEGVQAHTVYAVETLLDKDITYIKGDVIPAGVAVLLEGEAGDYDFEVTTDEGLEPENNMLHGTDASKFTDYVAEGMTTKYYKLSLDNDGKNVGFYWGATDGGQFTLSAEHQAYLAVDYEAEEELSAPKRFVLGGGEADGIAIATAENKQNGIVYNLAGQNVTKNFKGIVIKNGRKYLNK